MIAKTPQPPYFVVIFTSVRSADGSGYDEMAAKMAELSSQQPGFLGMEHAMSDGLSITVCYWASLEAVDGWKQNAAHKLAQQKGFETWYQSFETRVARVERDSFFDS